MAFAVSMPEHLRALIVILAAAALVFVLAEKPMAGVMMERVDYRRRRNVWFAVTLIGFFAHSFWIYVLLGGVLLAVQGRRDRNPLALYLLLMFAIPPFTMSVPGFGLVNYLFSLNHIKLLNLTVLLPMAIALARSTPSGARDQFGKADTLVLLYLGYTFIRRAEVLEVTVMMRDAFDIAVDVWLPYFVASRALRNLREWREAIGAFILAVVVISVMAPFEVVRGWLLYESMRFALDVPAPPINTYLWRGGGGPLRATGPVEHSLVLGYVVMLAILLFVWIAPSIRSRGYVGFAGLILISGLVASLSRGPWVGFAVGVLVLLSLGRDVGKRLLWLGGTIMTAAVALVVIPGGSTVIDYLPFVGSVDAENIEYRQRLIEVSRSVFLQNPLFGTTSWFTNPTMEELRQGQGIIDVTNSYLGVALVYGSVGLLLFISIFLYCLWAVLYSRSRYAQDYSDIDLLGRSLVSAVIAVMVTIGTMSGISVVAPVYWVLVGLCIGYARMLALSGTAARSSMASRVRPPLSIRTKQHDDRLG